MAVSGDWAYSAVGAAAGKEACPAGKPASASAAAGVPVVSAAAAAAGTAAGAGSSSSATSIPAPITWSRRTAAIWRSLRLPPISRPRRPRRRAATPPRGTASGRPPGATRARAATPRGTAATARESPPLRATASGTGTAPGCRRWAAVPGGRGASGR